jgi:hypothetical protein
VTDDSMMPEQTPRTAPSGDARRSRRSLIAGAAAAAGALVAQGMARPVSANDPNDVRKGAVNNTTAPTTVRNQANVNNATALVGRVTFTGVAVNSAGVHGDNAGRASTGVRGTAHTGEASRGVMGQSNGGTGVYGVGGHTGVRGRGTRYGVYGVTNNAVNAAGIYGENEARAGTGIVGVAHTGAASAGLRGQSNEGNGVFGLGGHTGIRGRGTNFGVFGISDSNYGVFGDGGYTGVFGAGPYGTYGTGSSAGAVGTSSAGYGLYGLGPVGVVGLANGDGYGVWGYGADSGAYGVVGQGGFRGGYFSGGNAAVYGTSGYVALWGNASTTSGLNYGVYATTGSQTQGYAGVFNGRVLVSGFLQKSGGGFVIDHPMEPERRYLVHSFVEAPEMLNVYSGTVTLNSRGRATVRLPRYFEVENSEHRYQLTPLGGPAPNLHVSRTVDRNRFSIAGGGSGQQVCWQVSGVRQDAWAKANPLRVEPLKARRDQGKFLTPKAHGRRASAGIHHLSHGRRPPLARKPRTLKRLPRTTVG